MSDNVTIPRSRTDYLAAYLGLSWQADLDAGLRTWLEAFQEALDNWQDDVCQRLLREIKQAPLTPEVEGLVRYVEGRWAEQRGDLEHAVRAYQASLELNREAEAVLRMAQVLGDLGLAHQALGQLSEAEESLRSALAIYRAAAETGAIFEVLNDLSSVLTSQGNWSEARVCLDDALDRAAGATDRAITLANLGVWYQAQGRSTEAEQHFQHALEIFRAAGAQPNMASVLNNLGALALDQRRPEEATTHLTEALAIYQSLGDWPNMVRMVGNLGLLAQESGNAEGALRHYTEAIESVGDLADARTIAILYNHRALLHADALAWEAAAADLEQSLNHLAQSGDQPTWADVLNNLGTAHRHLGRLDESLACYEQALALAEQLEDRRRTGEITGNLGHLYDLQDNPDGALACYQTSCSLAQQIGDPVMEAVALLGLCSIAWQQGDLAMLEPLLDQAWQLGETTDQPDVLARVGWLRGDMALLKENAAQTFQHYAQAAVHAARAGESLLVATLERIDMHCDILADSDRDGELAAAGQILRRTWAETGLLDEYPELHAYLDRYDP